MTNTVSGLDCRPNLKRENRSETGRGRCSVSENTCINEQENGNMGDNPLTGFEVDKSTLKYIGKDLAIAPIASAEILPANQVSTKL